MTLRQDPCVGRFIENHYALFFMPSCLNDAEGNTVYWNHHAERVTGLAAAEALGKRAYRYLVPSAPENNPLDLFIAEDRAALERLYGPEHLLWDAHGNLAVLCCPAPVEPASTGTGKAAQCLLLCGRWHDKESGKHCTYLAWSDLTEYLFTKSPSLDMYRLLHGLDRKRLAWFAIQQDEMFCYLSRDFMREIFPPEVTEEETIGVSMAQVMQPAMAQDHARTIGALTPEQSASTVLNWPIMFRREPKSWLRTYPNILTVNGWPANFSLVQDITAEKERDSTLQNLLTTHQLSAKSGMAGHLLASFAGRSQAIRSTLENLLRAALSLVNVTVYGETGTGKTTAARIVHQLSSRSEGPFVVVNCGAIPEELFESIFFGHVKGAFTGAIADKEGLLTSADNGTLFLDEISELSSRSQAKLLQALSEKSYTPVGSNRTLVSKFRLISATNQDLGEMVRRGLFREDLFYRVNVVDIHMPPLRRRKEDISLLAHNILSRHDQSLVLSNETVRMLETHDWPGNIRELENVILRYAVEHNFDFFRPVPAGVRGREMQAAPGRTLKDMLAACEKEFLLNALTEHRWNRGKTAEALGISRVTLFRRIKELGLNSPAGLED